jgi:ribosomal protein S18 acetylase RimI-like enzyme
MRIEFSHCESGSDTVKWCLYSDDKKGSVGKLVLILDKKMISATLSTIKIDEKYRGKGFANDLIVRMKEYLIDEGYDNVVLYAEEDMNKFGKLVNFYKTFGFIVMSKGTKFQMIHHEDQIFRRVPMICKLST